MIAGENQQIVRSAPTFHCETCGGSLEKGRADCPFCGALIDLHRTSLTAYCDNCFSMSRAGAIFCSGCGKPITDAPEAPSAVDEKCPRCSVPMRRRTLGSHNPLECPVCCGLFINSSDLGVIIEEQEKRNKELPGTDAPVRSSPGTRPVAYIRCPVCENMMNRMNYGRFSGVIIDYCREHGYWLDSGELEKIANWVSTGGLSRLRKREIEELKSEKSRLEGRLSVPMDPGDASRLFKNDSAPGAAMAGGGLIGLLFDLFTD